MNDVRYMLKIILFGHRDLFENDQNLLLELLGKFFYIYPLDKVPEVQEYHPAKPLWFLYAILEVLVDFEINWNSDNFLQIITIALKYSGHNCLNVKSPSTIILAYMCSNMPKDLDKSFVKDAFRIIANFLKHTDFMESPEKIRIRDELIEILGKILFDCHMHLEASKSFAVGLSFSV